jgi:hypothetical protein
MATTVKEVVTVSELVKGKFGAQIKAGKDYYSFSKNYKDGALEAGTTYEMEVYVSDKGYKYINRAHSVGRSVTPDKTTAPKETPERATEKAVDLKTRQIMHQGVYQAVVSNPALIGYASDVEAFKKIVRDIADDGVSYIMERTK